MSRIRRSMARRVLGRELLAALGGEVDMAQLWAVDALADAEQECGGAPGDARAEPGGVTVGILADRLGIDQSRASRVVAAAVTAGYIRRVASQADGRMSLLQTTQAGRRLVAEMRAFRETYFARLMASWSEEERRTFADLLARFTSEIAGER